MPLFVLIVFPWQEVIGSVLTLEMPDKTVHGDKMEQFIFDWLMSNKTQYIQKDPTPVWRM